MKTSLNALQGFNWTYTGPIKLFKGLGYNKKGVSRTMFMTPERLEDIPAELFAVKISQSADPAKAGRPQFKFFSFKLGSEGVFTYTAPDNITLQTPVEEIKAMVASKLGAMPDVELSISVSLTTVGYKEVAFKDQNILLYSHNPTPEQAPHLDADGDPSYYMSPDAIFTVSLKGALSAQNNWYLQSDISSEQNAEDVIVVRGSSAVVYQPGGTPSVNAVVETDTTIDPANPWG